MKEGEGVVHGTAVFSVLRDACILHQACVIARISTVRAARSSGYLVDSRYCRFRKVPGSFEPSSRSKTFEQNSDRPRCQFVPVCRAGAVNIVWRQAGARRAELPKDRMVVMYCNSGSLSAQAVFALRVLGYDNVKVLQDGRHLCNLVESKRTVPGRQASLYLSVRFPLP
jgi:rhodanese-related sulfurtransferase